MTNDSKSISISIEDIIEYWRTHEAGKSLREFLGMSENEHVDWLKGGISFQIDREKWEPCGELCRNNCMTCDHNADELFGDADYCKDCHGCSKWESSVHKFCERCGRPKTPEAWDELEKRLGGMME